MAQTPNSDLRSYLTPAEFLLRRDARPAGQLVRDDGTAASASDLASDPVLAAILKQCSGIVEAACGVGERYLPADLRAMADSGSNGGEMLKGLVADLAAGKLAGRRWELPQGCLAAYEEALQMVEKLERGLALFPFSESQAASVADNRDMLQSELDSLNLLSRNDRYFGRRGSYDTFGGSY